MRREPDQYREAALTVSEGYFDSKEKRRHYRELLAHMRAQFGDRLMQEMEHKLLYEWIVSLMNTT